MDLELTESQTHSALFATPDLQSTTLYGTAQKLNRPKENDDDTRNMGKRSRRNEKDYVYTKK
jgi:hypothetical protein